MQVKFDQTEALGTSFFPTHTYCLTSFRRLPQPLLATVLGRRTIDHGVGRDKSLQGTLRFFFFVHLGSTISPTPTVAPILGGTHWPHPHFRIAVLLAA